MNDISLTVAFLAGILYFFSPCVLPLVPSFLSFISGISFEKLKTNPYQARKVVVLNSLFFILGFSAVFVLLGVGFSIMGEYILRFKLPVQRIGGVIIILLGIYLLFQNRLKFFIAAKNFMPKSKPAGFLGVFFIGNVFAFNFTACATPFLAAILTIAGAKATAVRGAVLLGVFSLGIGIPFIISAFSLSLFLTVFEKARRKIRIFEIVSGLVLIFFGGCLLKAGF